MWVFLRKKFSSPDKMPGGDYRAYHFYSSFSPVENVNRFANAAGVDGFEYSLLSSARYCSVTNVTVINLRATFWMIRMMRRVVQRNSRLRVTRVNVGDGVLGRADQVRIIRQCRVSQSLDHLRVLRSGYPAQR